MSATLIAHRRAQVIPKADLYQIEPPAPTKSWRPISHGQLVETIHRNLQRKGVEVVREEYAVQRQNLLLFGVMDLQYGRTEELTAALGLRTSNDKSFALQIAVGCRVFVCDNLAFTGDLIAMKRKQTMLHNSQGHEQFSLGRLLLIPSAPSRASRIWQVSPQLGDCDLRA
jgi:hypothetical protein